MTINPTDRRSVIARAIAMTDVLARNGLSADECLPAADAVIAALMQSGYCLDAETAAARDDLRAELAVEREAGRIAREKAIHQHRENRKLRARLSRVVTWANARLSLDGFDPQDTLLHMGVIHGVAWEALEPGDFDPVTAADLDALAMALNARER